MKQTTALAWKEWHEARAYLWIALGVFLALPLIGSAQDLLHHAKRIEVFTSIWVTFFGGVLAVFVAVGVTCRDFDGRLEDFWRSRPVSVTRWLLVKFAIGLVVVLVGCALPLAVEVSINRSKEAAPMLAWFPYFWAALYGIAFLIGCLVRRTAHAGMLALAAMLLVYFLPAILPPLRFLNSGEIVDAWGRQATTDNLKFAGGMLMIAFASLVFALLAVRREWRVESGQKLMYGAISAAILILFASAAFQLGTNLPVIQRTNLDPGEEARWISVQDGRGFVVTTGPPRPTTQRSDFYTNVRSIQLTDPGIVLGKPIKADQRFGYGSVLLDATPPGHPELRYHLDGVGEEGQPIKAAVHLMHFDTGAVDEVARLPGEFKPYVEDSDANFWPTLFVCDDKLYAISKRLVTFDIRDPLKPRLISDEPFPFKQWSQPEGGETFILNLPQIPNLTPRQRLEAAFWMRSWWRGGLDGDVLCDASNGTLAAYRLASLTDVNATYQRIALREATTLERVFGIYGWGNFQMMNGLLYIHQGGGRDAFNAHVSVFDTRGDRPLKLIGHFAAPGVNTVCPLPDGRALVGGSKIWLVGKPR